MAVFNIFASTICNQCSTDGIHEQVARCELLAVRPIPLHNGPLPLRIPSREIFNDLPAQIEFRLDGKLLEFQSGAHTSRILPVSNSCIIPCLIARAFVSFPDSATISASMSESISAMAFCSGKDGSWNRTAISAVLERLCRVEPCAREESNSRPLLPRK